MMMEYELTFDNIPEVNNSSLYASDVINRIESKKNCFVAENRIKAE